ncbi:hypothetical protein HMPREF1093_03530 [Hungatella hathewayi 12489931]|jgi:predicted transcriptional regulator|uniref:helix-turn-helix domain-containing protein n=1 Tax=Hungatella hathewayi TaxID=154046 RepID=UPI0002D1916A|nr:helix-turn-helix domain-containing protein [Hungatella hathewayi]ENY93454.1 hypothetical protein HMPREF1093_03530 [Hungatella hathewayi 12489931]
MIRTDELRGIIAKNGLSQANVAEMLGITPKTFYEKMKKKKFCSDEIQTMIDNLKINDPCKIFFAEEVTLKDTKKENRDAETDCSSREQ